MRQNVWLFFPLHSPDNVTIDFFKCPSNWPDYENCIRLQFSIALWPDDPDFDFDLNKFDYELSTNSLSVMWDLFGRDDFVELLGIEVSDANVNREISIHSVCLLRSIPFQMALISFCCGQEFRCPLSWYLLAFCTAYGELTFSENIVVCIVKVMIIRTYWKVNPNWISQCIRYRISHIQRSLKLMKWMSQEVIMVSRCDLLKKKFVC